MNLILLEAEELTTTGTATVSDNRARHLLRVLHVAPGSIVRIGVIDGALGAGTVRAVSGSTVTLECAFTEVPPRAPLDLLLALPRPKIMRRLWAQLAALGVGRIILTNAERVERNYFDTHVVKPECYRPLLIEGLQQARDTRLPHVSIHRRFRVLVEDELDRLVGEARRIVAEPSAASDLSRVLRGPAEARRHPDGWVGGPAEAGRHAARVLVAVGPEGGWNAFELSLLEAHGFQRASMGPRTLRTDTACIALLAQVRQIMEICDL